MKSSKLIAAIALATVVTLSAPAFAQRTSTYPEGSIFLRPPVPQATVAAPKSPRTAKISPLNPLDAPDAGNVWKPSNRDAGNLTVERWHAYQDQIAAGRTVTK
jgi:hypothetical protein